MCTPVTEKGSVGTSYPMASTSTVTPQAPSPPPFFQKAPRSHSTLQSCCLHFAVVAIAHTSVLIHTRTGPPAGPNEDSAKADGRTLTSLFLLRTNAPAPVASPSGSSLRRVMHCPRTPLPPHSNLFSCSPQFSKLTCLPSLLLLNTTDGNGSSPAPHTPVRPLPTPGIGPHWLH